MSARRTLSGWVGAALLSAICGCHFFDAEVPACTTDAGPLCSEEWCGDLVVPSCQKKARRCNQPAGECDIAVCAAGAASGLRSSENPAAAAKAFSSCVSRNTECPGIEDC